MTTKEAFVIETLRESDHDTNRNLVKKPVPVRCSFERPRRGLYTNNVAILKEQYVKMGCFQISVIAFKNYLNSGIITMIIMMITVWRITQCIIKNKEKRNSSQNKVLNPHTFLRNPSPVC